MNIKKECKLRNIAGEDIIMLQGKAGVDMTKVIALNKTSVWLFNQLYGKIFDREQVATLLCSQYDVQRDIAERDTVKWIDGLIAIGCIEHA